MDFLADPETQEFAIAWDGEAFEKGRADLVEGEFYPYPRYWDGSWNVTGSKTFWNDEVWSEDHELRLYDEKRKYIRIGDFICFYCTENQTQTIEVQVLNLHIFDNFAQLYKELDLLSCGYTQSSIREAKPEDMEVYYSREQLEQYGAVGTELRVIDSIWHSVFSLAWLQAKLLLL